MLKGKARRAKSRRFRKGTIQNFLAKQGLAKIASDSNIKVMDQQKNSEKKKKDNEKAEAQALADKIGELTLQIKGKAGDAGRLFGSITSKQIAEELERQYKITIDKRKMTLDDPIRVLGTTSIPIKLHIGVVATLQVQVTEA